MNAMIPVRRLAHRGLRAAVLMVVILTLAAAVVFPLYWMIVQSLQAPQYQFAYPPSLFPLGLTFDAYARVFTQTPLVIWLRNSALVSGIAALLSVLMGAWGAYAISRFRTRGTGIIAYLILVSQMIPLVVLMIPLYSLFVSLHLVDHLAGLVALNVVFTLPVTTWMLKGIFDTVPEELEEAALIDGCNRLGALRHVTFPLARAGFVAAGIFAFVQAWDEYLFTVTLINSPSNWVASIGIASFFTEYDVQWDQVMAASVIVTLIPVVLFLFAQRYFVEGLTGGLKG